MTTYHKKKLNPSEVNALCAKYGLSQLESSILLRRGITDGEEIKFFLEKDLRFAHQPFMFSGMEDAVERINQAIDEKEKVLIFGDKDVDGVSSTAILFEYLTSMGLDVKWRLPVGEDSYGLSISAVDDFAAEYGSLIITVDCGISNNIEIDHANELGLDVIVTDHHNPPDELPEASVIIDPKLKDSGYPFKDISGAAVAFKLVSALRMSRMEDIYGVDFCLLDIKENDGIINIECLKTKNLVKKETLFLEFKNFPVSIYETSLIDFLKGEIILVWDKEKAKRNLSSLFGSSIDFQMLDMRNEIAKLIPSFYGKKLEELKKYSAMAKYSEKDFSNMDVFFSIFVTYTEQRKERMFPNLKENVEKDLQLVALAALADIMPMKNENRIFVKSALETINSGKIRPGLLELAARGNLLGKKITSTDLSWSIIPVLNAAGRLGKSNLALELLISNDPKERATLSDKIISLNEQRKTFVQNGETLTLSQAKESFSSYGQKLCLVYDKKIFRGITGILSGNIMKKYKVPSLAVTFTEDGSVAVGSMRSCRGIKATEFLAEFGKDFFINYGGHDAAAGFSFTVDKLESFLKKTKEISENLSLSDEDETVEVDAELPSENLNPEIFRTLDFFEPYGEGNRKLIFQTRNITVHDASICGKTERQHLKLTLDCTSCKFPGMFWGEAERLGRDFSKGDSINIVYNINRNYYNGNMSPQIQILEIPKSLT